MGKKNTEIADFVLNFYSFGIWAFTGHKKVNVNKFASSWACGWCCIKLSLVTIIVYYLSVESDLPVVLVRRQFLPVSTKIPESIFWSKFSVGDEM